MSEITSGIANQIFQQTLENQTQKQQQPQTNGKRTFESYIQEMQEARQNNQTNQTEQTQPTTKTTTSGVEMQSKLDQMQAELAQRFGQKPADKSKINGMMSDLMRDSETRLGMLKEAYSKVGNTSKVTSDLPGRFTQVEMEYKQVEAIMRSDKNLSPGELLALQARLYQVSQHIEVLSKVVDQMAGGIKTVLNTNV